MTPRRRTGSGQALNDLAVVAATAQRTEEAERFLLETQACEPDYLPALQNLGAWCVTRGDLVQATHWFKRATEVAPDDDEARSSLAEVLRERRRDGRSAPAVRRRGDRPAARHPVERC